MKNYLLLVGFLFTISYAIAQTSKFSSIIYAAKGPDGTIALTFKENLSEKQLKIQSKDRFYKYQLLDISTSEPVFSANNRSKECTIDTSNIGFGTYRLRLFTKNFIITKKITLGAAGISFNTSDAIAMKD